MEPQINRKQQREMTLQKPISTEDSNVFDICFSSEEPVVRIINDTEYNEILLNSPSNVDLTRVTTNNAPVLFNHDPDQLIGTILNARIDPDRKGRAQIQISNTATDKLEMIRECILKSVSVGYQINDYELRGNDLLVTSWELLECSLVSTPADISCGIGRSIDEEEITLPEQESKDTTANTSESEPEQEQEQEQELSTDTDEVKEEQEVPETDSEPEVNTDESQRDEIIAMARVLNLSEEIVNNALTRNFTAEQFRNEITAVNKKENKQKENIEMDFQTVLRKLADNDKTDLKTNSRGHTAITPDMIVRAAGNTTANTGALITEQIEYGSFLDALRGESILGQLPTMNLYGLTDTVSVPHLAADFTWQVLEEGQAPTDQTANITNTVFKPQVVAAAVPTTKQLLLQSPQTAGLISTSMIKSGGVQLEKQYFSMIADEAATTSITAWSYDAIINAIGTLSSQGVSEGSMIAVMSPDVAATLRTTLIDANTNAKFVLEGDLLCGGLIKALISSHVPAGTFIIGDYSRSGLAEWEAVSVDMDDTTLRSAGGLVIRVWAAMDWHVMDANAFLQLKVTEAVQATKK